MSYRLVSGIYCSPTLMDPRSDDCGLSISAQLLIASSENAGPSTALRSCRDDNFVANFELS